MAEKPNVTRIKAKDDAPIAKSTAKKAKQAKEAEPVAVSAKAQKLVKEKTPRQPKGGPNVFVRIGGYFKGAWVELRQVRWPNRRATWGLTLAVIVFSLILTILILTLDALFKYLFQLIIG